MPSDSSPNKQLLQNAVPAKIDKHAVSAASLHTARVLLQNFELTPKPMAGRNPPTIPATEYNVALLVDVCSNVFRLYPFKESTADLYNKVSKGTATVDEVRKFLYDLGVVLNRLPTYG